NNDEIIKLFNGADTDATHKYISATLAKDPTISREDALLEIYRKMRPGEPVTLENAEDFFNGLFFDQRRYDLGKVGRFKINKRLNLTTPNEKANWILTKQDIISSLVYLVKLQNGEGRLDDIDHLSNRRLKRVGELVSTHAFRI